MGIRHIAVFGALLVFLCVMPIIVSAQPSLVPACEGPTCDFGHLMQLIKNVMRFLLGIAIPLFAIIFSWAGFLMLTAGGKAGQIEKAKKMMGTAFIGFIIALSAYIIVTFLINIFLSRAAKKDVGEFIQSRIPTSYEIV